MVSASVGLGRGVVSASVGFGRGVVGAPVVFGREVWLVSQLALRICNNVVHINPTFDYVRTDPHVAYIHGHSRCRLVQ